MTAAELQALELPAPRMGNHRQGNTMSERAEQINELGAIYQDTLNRGHGIITRFEQGTRAAEAILAAGYTKPRQVTTVEELDALPDMTVVIDCDGDPWQKEYGRWRNGPGWQNSNLLVTYVPIAIVYSPVVAP